MIKMEFSAEEIEQLHFERRHHPHARVRQRMETVYLKALGLQHQAIGRIVQIDQKTLRNYLRLYQAGGLAALKHLNFHQPVSALHEHHAKLKAEFCTSSKPLGHLGMKTNGDSQRHDLIIHRQESSSVDGVRTWFLA